VVILILGGVSISLVFRYVLNWQSSQQDYIRFTILWVLYLVGYFFIHQPTPEFSKDKLIASLEYKCRSQASSCGLRARMFITDGEFDNALEYIEKGLDIDENIYSLLQMRLIVLLYRKELLIQDDVKQWLIRYPNDIWVRQVYAEQLIKHNELQLAYIEYQALYNALSSLNPMQKKVAETIELLRNDLDARKLISNTVV